MKSSMIARTAHCFNKKKSSMMHDICATHTVLCFDSPEMIELA